MELVHKSLPTDLLTQQKCRWTRKYSDDCARSASTENLPPPAIQASRPVSRSVRNYAGLRFRRRWLRSGPLFAAIFAEVGCDGLWSYPTVIPAPERHLCVSASSYPSLEGRSLASFVPRSSTRSCLCAQGETVVNPHNPLFPRSEPFSSWKGASCQPLSIFEPQNMLCSLLRRLRRLLGALPDILRQ